MKKINKKEFHKRFQQAQQAIKVKDFHLAEELTLYLMGQLPDQWTLHLMLGNVFSGQQKHTEAIGQYKKVLRIDPENVEALNNLGILFRKTGDFAKAGECLKRALKLAPERSDLLYNRGNLYKATGNMKLAIKDYQRVIELDNRYTQAYNNLGTIYLDKEDYNRAAEYYDQGLLQDPQNAMLLYNRAVLYQNQQNWSQAEEYFRRALKSRPGWEDCQNNLAIIVQEKGNLDEAKKLFHEILNKDRNNPRVLNNMGVVLTQMGEDEQAESLYKEALDLSPDYRNASLNLNKVYSHRKDYAKALEEMNRMTTLYPFDMEIRTETGRALIRLNQLKEAGDAFEHVLERDPENKAALKALAELSVRIGEEDKGWDYLQRVGYTLFMEDGEALLSLADAFRKNGNNERSEELLRRYEDFAPGDDRVRRRLARIYEDLNQWDQALKMLERLGDSETPEDMSRKVKINLNKGNKSDALKEMDQLMTLQSQGSDPDDMDKFREFLELYEETTESIMEENRDHWEQNISRLSRSLRSMQPPEPPEEEPEDYRLQSLSTQSLSEEDNMTLLDINAMEPIIEINEEKEILYLEEEEEDFSDIYTEVMEEEKRKQEREMKEKMGIPPYMPFPQQQPQAPIVVPMPQYRQSPSPSYPVPPPVQMPQAPPPPPPMEEPMMPPPLPEEELLEEEPMDDILTTQEKEELLRGDEDMEISFQEEEEPLDNELFLNDEEESLDSEDAAEEIQPEIPEAPPQTVNPENIQPAEEVLAEIPENIQPAEEMFAEIPENIHLVEDQYSEYTEKNPPPAGKGSQAAARKAECLNPEPHPEKEPDKSLDRLAVANMFKYLSTLTESLPENKKKEMDIHEVPLKMEVVRSKLEGERSLLNTASHYDRRNRDRVTDISIDDEKLSNSLSFFKNMAHEYPDMKVSQNFDTKMENLLSRIKKMKEQKL